MIVLRDVVQQFSGRVVLEIPVLHFVPGRHYGLIGENGSGKTTLIRMLAGTSKPTAEQLKALKAKLWGTCPSLPMHFLSRCSKMLPWHWKVTAMRKH